MRAPRLRFGFRLRCVRRAKRTPVIASRAALRTHRLGDVPTKPFCDSVDAQDVVRLPTAQTSHYTRSQL